MIKPMKRLAELGFKVVATGGTSEFLRKHGVEAQRVVEAGDFIPDPLAQAERRKAVRAAINQRSNRSVTFAVEQDGLIKQAARQELFAQFLALLVEFNQGWAKNASVLIFVVSEEAMVTDKGSNPNHSHSFDAGAAWANLALQAPALGYYAHGMTGVDFDAARTALNVPEGFRVEAAVAIGTQTTPEGLPEYLREREVPSTRKPVGEIAWSGAFR